MTRRITFLLLLPLLASACEAPQAEPAAEEVSAEVAVEPAAAPAAEDRVYELRTYTTHPGKLEDLHRRFRDHTTGLFEKHGMKNEGYWVPQDSALADHTLIYVLSYPSWEAREASWDGFRNDPEWHAARDASEEAGPIVERVTSVRMEPTDYSAMR